MRIKNLSTGDTKGAKVKGDFFSDSYSPSGRIKNDISSGKDPKGEVNIKNVYPKTGKGENKNIKNLDIYNRGRGKGFPKNLDK